MEDINQDSEDEFYDTVTVEQEEKMYRSDSDMENMPGEKEEVDGEEVYNDATDKKKADKVTVGASSTNTNAIERVDKKSGRLASDGSKDKNISRENELEARVKELEAANTLKDKTIAKKNKLLKDKGKDMEILRSENVNWNTLVNEMKGRVECQVCFLLPKQGPVPMCPNGHFICSDCKARNRQEGKVNCPTCKEPLGEIKSLLAKTVIDNVMHECDLEGCQEMIHLSGYKRHQDRCEFRLVLCPGSGRTCNKFVAFSEVEIHISSCLDMVKGFSTLSEKGVVYKKSDRLVATQNQISFWQTTTIKQNNATFFFKMRKLANSYQMEVVMKGSESDCNLFTSDISILDYESEAAVLKTCFQPRPIDTEKWGTFIMMVPQIAMARVWKPIQEQGNYFKLSVKISKTG